MIRSQDALLFTDDFMCEKTLDTLKMSEPGTQKPQRQIFRSWRNMVENILLYSMLENRDHLVGVGSWKRGTVINFCVQDTNAKDR